MVGTEFAETRSHVDIPPVALVDFPHTGRVSSDVVEGVRRRLAENSFAVEKNFSITYSGLPAAIGREIEELTVGRYFVEWASDTETGTLALEREAVGMMAGLLGKPDAPGFITTGGTESNILALRIARNLAKMPSPEFIVPTTSHFSFRSGAELLGIELVEVEVDRRTYLPRIEDVEAAITPRTIGLACTAPAPAFGTLDPVEAFADLAWRKGLHLHVDAAFGGFILPFMRDLGRDVPPFDLSLPGVSSISTDGHKLGLLPIATGFMLAREAAHFESIPTERTLIHTISSTKPASRAAIAWATMQHLGREGYCQSTEHVLGLTDLIVEGVTAIEGVTVVVPPMISVVAFTSEVVDLHRVHLDLLAAGWGHSFGVLHDTPYIRLSVHPSRDVRHAEGFVTAFVAAADRARI